jgi:AraC family transcriptional regulator
MAISAGGRQDYEERVERVIAYVYAHLDDELDLNRLAEIACLSPHHWHRVYVAMRGESLAATIKRLRLNRAAGYLAQTSMSIDAIATRSGYPNVQSFTRTFKTAYGMPPATYRLRGSHTHFQHATTARATTMYDVTIKRVPAITMATVPHIGSYMEISQAFDRLFGWLASKGLIGPGVRSFGIFYDDPSMVAPAKLRSRAGAVMTPEFAAEPPVERAAVEGGEYAVLRHRGPYADMKAAYDWLYGHWLPQSGREPGRGPNLEEYLNSPRDTQPVDLLSDIYLPLA